MVLRRGTWTAYSAPVKTGSGVKMVPLPVSTFGAIDWNNNGEDDETGIWANINYYSTWPFRYDSGNADTLKGFDDWQNLRFAFQETKDYEDGVHSSDFGVDELTWETVQAMRDAFLQVRNLAVLNVFVPQGNVGGAGFVSNLTVANLGGSNETCSVAIFANSTSIASRILKLDSGNFAALNLPCDIKDLPYGSYVVTARIIHVTNETYTADNTVSGGVINVVDEAPPVTVADYDDLWHISDFVVPLEATDDMSGVAETFYVVNGESVVRRLSVDGVPQFASDGANNTLRYWSVDLVGNVEQGRWLSGIKLDKIPPTLTINVPAAGGQVGTSVAANWAGLDETSGVKLYEVRVDDGLWMSIGSSVSHEFSGLGEGSHVIEVRATDTAGNVRLASSSFSVNSRPWLLPIVVGGLIVLVVAFVFFRRVKGANRPLVSR